MEWFSAIVAAAFLVWLAATGTLAVCGLRRWRWRTPGGGWAVLSAGLGFFFPIVVLVNIVVTAVNPRRGTAFLDHPAVMVSLGTIWAASVAAGAIAAGRALQTPAEPDSVATFDGR
ncbi:MAG: hypothetical protein AAF907_14040, partial [Planctomycetota bacterium]